MKEFKPEINCVFVVYKLVKISELNVMLNEKKGS